jgi:flavin-dependent dehydrogenase
MSSDRHDVLVIGAGPAGLAAARAAAEAGARTLVLERLGGPGELGHPCSAAMAPLPGRVRGLMVEDGVRFAELDLVLPRAAIVGHAREQRFVSPAGHAFRARFPCDADAPVLFVDKTALLRILAQQATDAGADLRFGVQVDALLQDAGRVNGVRTRGAVQRAAWVIGAEGSSRRFAEAAGLFARGPTPRAAFRIVSRNWEAPAATAEDVGQLSTWGRRYTSAPCPAFGTVVVPEPGRAMSFFSWLEDDRAGAGDAVAGWAQLDEYESDDPRVRGLFLGGRPLGRSGTRLVVRDAARSAVAPGFLGVGDSVGPGGHVGILAAAWLGHHAGVAAAHAASGGSAGPAAVGAFDRRRYRPLRRGLDAESRIIESLLRLSDDELDRLARLLAGLDVGPFITGAVGPMARSTARWLATSWGAALRELPLLRRFLGGTPAR